MKRQLYILPQTVGILQKRSYVFEKSHGLGKYLDLENWVFNETSDYVVWYVPKNI